MKRGVRSRLIVKLTLCTLAGAAVTWGVAWGCALWAPPTPIETAIYRLARSPTGDLVPAEHGTGWYEYWRLTRADRFENAEEIKPPSWAFILPGCESTGCFGYGVPAVCLVQLTGLQMEPTMAYRTTGWILPGKAQRALPTHILPLGFTLNTLLAAGVLLSLVESFAFARRRVRRAKGRCVACGYDRGGLAGGEATACPECGAAALS